MRTGGLAAVLVTVVLALSAAGPAEAIVGGRAATPTDNPSMVGLVVRGESARDGLFCGGALIAPTVAVTAMHCLEQFAKPNGDVARQLDVVGGALSRSAPTLKRVRVAAVVRNPRWDDNRALHDILVLRLASPLPLPALALAGPEDAALWAPGSVLSATGWGLTSSRNDDLPDFLRQADIPVVRDAVCRAAFGAAIFDGTYELCGQAPSGKPDTCQGDSGGPLIGGNGDAARLVGVVSYGPATCGEAGGSAVYADVASERDWILTAAGLSSEVVAAPLVTPQPTPAPGSRSVTTRIGAMSCGATTCRVTILTSGKDRAAVGDVILRVVRKRQKGLAPAKRFVRARKSRAGTYIAKTLLPYGTLTVTAVAYDAAGVQLGKAARETIEVE
jgi:secreted trypsin-like serine protease